MRSTLLVLLLSLGCASATAPVPGDDYLFVFLRRPANAPQLDEATSHAVQDGHMANIRRLGAEGHIVAAGPFLDDTSLRGIFVFRTASRADGESWLATDPAVKAGRLSGDFHAMRVPASSFAHIEADAPFKPAKYAMLIIPATTSRSKITKAIADAEAASQLALGTPFAEGGGVIIVPGEADAAKSLAESLNAEVHPWMTQEGVLKR